MNTKHLASAFVFFLAILSTPRLGLCDDSAVEVYGGAAEMRTSGSTDVSMVSETVIITLGREKYFVDATFEFFNYGKTTNITVGFPQTGHPYQGLTFSHFQTWVNGEKVQFRSMSAVIEMDGKEHQAEKLNQDEAGESDSIIWLVKTVNFPGNQKTITRVKYDAPYGEMTGTKPMFLTYWFGTGNSWKGNIGEAKFIVRSSPKAWIYPNPYQSDIDKKFTFARLGEYEHEYSLKDFEPDKMDAFKMWVSTTVQPWESYGSENKCVPYAYADEKIPDQLLEIMSLKQLRIFRNSFYAAHGQKFKSVELNNYFKKYCVYDAEFGSSEMNEIEKVNVRKISRYEKKLREQNKKADKNN